MSSAISKLQLLETLSAIDFADRYYTLCTKFSKSGPVLPVDQQRLIMEELGRDFVYSKKEKFFSCRTAISSDLVFGLNVIIRDSTIELGGRRCDH